MDFSLINLNAWINMRKLRVICLIIIFLSVSLASCEWDSLP